MRKDETANAITSVQTDSLVFTLRMRSGCDGGGKGALIQEDKSGTLACNNDQTLIIINDQGGAVMNIEKNDVSPTLRSQTHQHEPIVCMATGQGGAEVRTDDKAPCLTAMAGMSGNNKPVICFDPKWLTATEKATSIMGENAKDNPCVCYAEKRFFDWKEDEKSVSLRAQGASYGGAVKY